MTTPEENLEMTTSDEWRKWAERNAPYARIVGRVIIFNPDMDDPPSSEDMDDPPSSEDMAWHRLAYGNLYDEDDAEEKG